MAREYTLRAQITNPVSGRAMIQLAAGAAMPFTLIDAQVTQRDSATGAQLGVQIARLSAAQTVTAAVLGTHIFKNDPADANPALQLGTALTGITGTTAGTLTDIPVDEGWYTLSGDFVVPIPEKRLTVPSAGLIALILTGTVPAGVFTALMTIAEGITG